jgi:uncharacterized lipoprotein YddW (UPF0748 family)
MGTGMKRRQFLETLGGAAALWSLGSAGVVGCRPRPPRGALPRNWVWVHGGRERDAAQWRRRFARLRSAGIGGVLVGGGETGMLSEVAHTEGLAFHRWTWMLNRAGDRWAKEHHPEWYTVSRDGYSSLTHPPYVDYYQWVCPTRAAVRQYLADLAGGIAADPAVDGVHLDYIRHADVILPVGLWSKYGLVQDRELPEFDFCYCEVCRETFARQTGGDPLSLADPTQDVAWREFRWRSVTELVQRVSESVRREGKPISAAVFPTPALARRLVRQAWDRWPLDAVFPMLYHEFYGEDVAWIEEASREGARALAGRSPLYSGLYLPDLSPEDLAQAVRAALRGGASGVALFEVEGLTETHLEQLADVLQP